MTLPDDHEVRHPYYPKKTITWGEEKERIRAQERRPELWNPNTFPVVDMQGSALRFPLICPHCGTTYWYRPCDEFGKDLPAECAIALLEESIEGKKNLGSIWWQCLWEEGVKIGKKSGTPAERVAEAPQDTE